MLLQTWFGLIGLARPLSYTLSELRRPFSIRFSDCLLGIPSRGEIGAGFPFLLIPNLLSEARLFKIWSSLAEEPLRSAKTPPPIESLRASLAKRSMSGSLSILGLPLYMLADDDL